MSQNFFYRDIEKDVLVSWEQLVNEVVNAKEFNPFCKALDYYEVFKSIILSLLLNKSITLLDGDFSENELLTLTGSVNFDSFVQKIDNGLLDNLANKEELINRIKNTSSDWKITIYTSGTTGVPKNVTHTFQTITKNIKTKGHHDDVWGFAYNPTHMAGLQVFLQALINGNFIVRLFNMPTTAILNEIEVHQVTHISATPSFYRLLLPTSKPYTSVKRITFGGEKFSGSTAQQLSSAFPNATLTNVYASTEAGALFASKNDIFIVNEKIASYVKIVDSTLVIHKDLLGEAQTLHDSWYDTGDVVELIEENPLTFKFVSRKSEMINVGGYKVNPTEVEEALNAIAGIKHAVVYAKSNSILGNIVVCNVVSSDKQLTESAIRAALAKSLQEFKIPRIIKFVEEISTTRTGKVKRNN